MKNYWLAELNVYHLDDGEQWWYVARSADDALVQHREQMDDPNDIAGVEVTELSSDTCLVIYNEDDGSTIKKSCREWASEGRGCIGSTVW